MIKTILMSAFVALTVAACAHKTAEHSCVCGKDKAACAETKECPMHKDAGCANCKGDEKTAAGK